MVGYAKNRVGCLAFLVLGGKRTSSKDSGGTELEKIALNDFDLAKLIERNKTTLK